VALDYGVFMPLCFVVVAAVVLMEGAIGLRGSL